MKDLIIVELYKFRKRKILLIAVLLNIFTLIYSLGIAFNWDFIIITGTFDMIEYINNMWYLMFMLGIPIIFFMIVSANILGGEKTAGQIMLEVTRVADRKKLISAKMISVIVLVFLYFISNVIISAVSYLLLVKNTQYATSELIIFNQENIEFIIQTLCGLVFMMIISMIVMCVSIQYNTVISTMIGLGIYMFFMFVARVHNDLCTFIPGYYTLNETAEISLVNNIKQVVICAMIMIGMFISCRQQFSKVDL